MQSGSFARDDQISSDWQSVYISTAKPRSLSPLLEALVLSGRRPSTINPQGVRYASHAAATRLRLLTR